MNDRLTTLLQRFPLNAGPVRPTPLSAPVSPDTALPSAPGWLHLLLHGPVQIDGMDEAPTRIGRQQLLQPALLWLPSPTAHTLRAMSDRGATLLSTPVHFGDPALNPLIGALPLLVVVPQREMPPPMAATWALLVGEHEAAADAHGEVLARLAEALLLQVLRQAVDGARGRVGLLGALSDERLRRVLDAVHAHPGLPWTLQTLAAEAGWSRTVLATRFRAAVGVPPGDYLTDWRLRVARIRLAEGWPVKTVAEAVGYASAAALTRICTQRLGAPPSHWHPRHSRHSRHADHSTPDSMP
ncbi:AraC family transcriptional regulator [Sphaerotilus sp.]|uniref:helix-turn-helix transcriptional regulator n=1 Tax=Sphaerotilus sp. TaxID=2093942 RepID=UPI002ACD567D|nr:AraC family transcriptional regulator [Sphaerotilus sp.]MDZ7858958.1 AraC family transcriptional regulator [Sphaerotilus sp.]